MIHSPAILGAYFCRLAVDLGLAAREARPNHSKTRQLAQWGLVAVVLAASCTDLGHHIGSRPDHIAPHLSSALQVQPDQAVPTGAWDAGTGGPRSNEVPSRTAFRPTPSGPLGSRIRPTSSAYAIRLQFLEEDAPGHTYSPAPTRPPGPDQAVPERSAQPETPAVNGARLSIPYLNVDEPVAVIGIRDGQWDISQLGTNVGWLTTTGAHPGDDLAMAFVGHITVSAARRGPFANLLRLPSRADVIYSSGGKDYIYAVREKASALPEDVKRLYVADGHVLLLVTCTDWDYLGLTYSKRLIVRAELVKTVNRDEEIP